MRQDRRALVVDAARAGSPGPPHEHPADPPFEVPFVPEQIPGPVREVPVPPREVPIPPREVPVPPREAPYPGPLESLPPGGHRAPITAGRVLGTLRVHDACAD